MYDNITAKERIRLFLFSIPKYWLWEFPRRLIYFARTLLSADLIAIIGTIEVSQRPEEAVLHELNSSDHAWLDVKDRLVVDLGAYVGDTAIYFAKRGAKHVYAYESRCNVVEVAEKLVKQYGCEGGITLYCDFIDSSKFDKLVEELQIEDAALKVDIEGGEREVILNASSATLKRFSMMHIECHYGYLDIEERLKNEGFQVTHTKPLYTWRRAEEPMVRCDLYAREL